LLLNCWIHAWGEGTCQTVIQQIDIVTLAAAIEMIVKEAIETMVAFEKLKRENKELWQQFNNAMDLLNVVNRLQRKIRV